MRALKPSDNTNRVSWSWSVKETRHSRSHSQTPAVLPIRDHRSASQGLPFCLPGTTVLPIRDHRSAYQRPPFCLPRTTALPPTDQLPAPDLDLNIQTPGNKPSYLLSPASHLPHLSSPSLPSALLPHPACLRAPLLLCFAPEQVCNVARAVTPADVLEVVRCAARAVVAEQDVGGLEVAMANRHEAVAAASVRPPPVQKGVQAACLVLQSLPHPRCRGQLLLPSCQVPVATLRDPQP
eukprot:366502-Chlamydomonas_euryale.AAC.4